MVQTGKSIQQFPVGLRRRGRGVVGDGGGEIHHTADLPDARAGENQIH